MGNDKTVLLVMGDSERDLSDLLARTLEASEIAVITQKNEKAALKILREVPIDFIGFLRAQPDHELGRHQDLLFANLLAQSEALAFGLLFLAVVGTWTAWKTGALAGNQLAYAPAATLIVLGVAGIIATFGRPSKEPTPTASA